MAVNAVRERLTDYAVFYEGKELLGMADVELPSIEYLSESIKGPGIGGEVEMPTVGMTGNLEISVNWRTINQDLTRLFAPKAHDIEFRGAISEYDSATGEIIQKAAVVKMRGLPKSMELGKLDIGATNDSKNTFNCTYLKVEIGGAKRVEIDKFARVFYIQGTDYYADIRKALGL